MRKWALHILVILVIVFYFVSRDKPYNEMQTVQIYRDRIDSLYVLLHQAEARIQELNNIDSIYAQPLADILMLNADSSVKFFTKWTDDIAVRGHGGFGADTQHPVRKPSLYLP
jgi:hypothetical protein